MGSLPGSTAIKHVLVVVVPCVLGATAGPGLYLAFGVAVSTRSTALMSTSGVF